MTYISMRKFDLNLLTNSVVKKIYGVSESFTMNGDYIMEESVDYNNINSYKIGDILIISTIYNKIIVNDISKLTELSPYIKFNIFMYKVSNINIDNKLLYLSEHNKINGYERTLNVSMVTNSPNCIKGFIESKDGLEYPIKPLEIVLKLSDFNKSLNKYEFINELKSGYYYYFTRRLKSHDIKSMINNKYNSKIIIMLQLITNSSIENELNSYPSGKYVHHIPSSVFKQDNYIRYMEVDITKYIDNATNDSLKLTSSLGLSFDMNTKGDNDGLIRFSSNKGNKYLGYIIRKCDVSNL